MRVEIKNTELFHQTLSKLYPKLNSCSAKGITVDSRKVKKGDIFVAIKGEFNNGHDFILEAIKLGASICIVEEKKDENTNLFEVSSTRNFLNKIINNYRCKLNFPIIGITGSNGKTTTKDLLFHVLSKNNKIISSEGNYNSTIGAPLSILRCDTDLDYAVLEIGASKPNEIEYICNIIKPNIGIITNIHASHIKYFGSIKKIAKTKSALFNLLPKDGVAFINMDDRFIKNMTTQSKRIEFSFNDSADFHAKWNNKNGELLINNTLIKLNSFSDALAKNALGVFSIASYLDEKTEIIKNQIESFIPTEGRGNIIKIKELTIINDTYNSNLESAITGINNLISIKSNNRKIVVIGDMLELGKDEKYIHEMLGIHISNKSIDAVFAYGNLTKYTICALKGISGVHKFYENKSNLISDLTTFLNKRDILYVKGSRGMGMEDIIQGLIK